MSIEIRFVYVCCFMREQRTADNKTAMGTWSRSGGVPPALQAQATNKLLPLLHAWLCENAKHYSSQVVYLMFHLSYIGHV